MPHRRTKAALPCWLALALAAVLGLAACSGPAQTRTDPATGDETADNETADNETPDSDTSSGEASELEALYWARQDSARSSFTEADVRFMTGMIKHHAQAVVMSRLAPTHGASEQVQTLARRIINAQQDEIASMQAWLRRRDQHVPEIEMDGTHLTADGKSIHGMPMQGVLTQKQIQDLDAAHGRAFDRLFLTYMIEHHSGAVTMVDRLVGTGGAAQDEAAFKLASDIHVDQKTEIARMRRVLRSLPEPSQAP